MAEFEFKASRKMLYPYLNTASGLSQWFAEDANINEDKLFTFFWDDEAHPARIATQRLNRYVKFEFLENNGDRKNDLESYPKEPYHDNKHDATITEHLPFVEMRLDENDLTGTVFLKVTDTATTEDEEEFREIWRQLTDTLKEIVGG